MRLVTYQSEGRWRSGIAIGEWVVDSLAAAERANFVIDPSMQFSNREIIQLTPEGQTNLEFVVRAMPDEVPASDAIYRSRDVLLGPPVPDPDKIVCLGLNYRSHADEIGFATPTEPVLFAKFRNALTGPTGKIILPALSQEIDYEGELAVVIGKRCKNVSKERALEYVAGYMALNDVSARDLQFRTGQWLSGKTLDTFAPCGPALVINEITDPQNINITTRINGQIFQQGNTGNMIFPVPVAVAYISRLMTLEPGDIIATGTPEGVGFKRNPPIFLRDGDVVEVEVEGIGSLRNPVIAVE